MTKETKLEKIIAWGIIGISVAAIGTVSVMGYLSKRDAKIAGYSLAQKHCSYIKDEALTKAKEDKDEFMQQLLEKEEWCTGHDYDDTWIVRHLPRLLEAYIDNNKK